MMLLLSRTQAAARPFAQIAGVGVYLVKRADAVEQAGGIEGRMPAAGFVMYEQ
jgi:hypothetical protein